MYQSFGRDRYAADYLSRVNRATGLGRLPLLAIIGRAFNLAGIVLAFSSLLSACASMQQAPGKLKSTPHETIGVASIYSGKFSGRLTANGEHYDPKALTAAHPTFAFGTLVRVLNLENGKSVVVRINDRGPYESGRLIDLSAHAAKLIGMLEDGLARVSIRVVQLPGQ